MGLLTALTIKKLEFKIQDGGRKTVKLPNLCNSSTDFDEIWHGDAYWPLE